MDEHLIPALLNWASSQIKTNDDEWKPIIGSITTHSSPLQCVGRPDWKLIQNKPKILGTKRQNTEQTKNTWGKETKYRTNRKYLGQRDKIQNKLKIHGAERQNTENTEKTLGKETKYRTNRKYLGQRDKIQNKPKILGAKGQNTEQT